MTGVAKGKISGGGGNDLCPGDFTSLASDYACYRPGYAPIIRDIFLGLTGLPTEQIVAADIGAGTGIWSRMLADKGVQVTAVEPNDAMREHGLCQTGALPIRWVKGNAEQTTCLDAQYDVVCMASSFHWMDFEKAMEEVSRILKPGGWFLALWNTRYYESNPLLVRIEETLYRMVPELTRVSSGRSVFCEQLMGRLQRHPLCNDVVYLEGRHTEQQTCERYVGIWKSVNDIRVQAGEQRFQEFLTYIEQELQDIHQIDAEYSTRAWIARLHV